MNLISAREALRLPSAQLKPTDADEVAKVIAHVNEYARAHMTRRGCTVPMDAVAKNLNDEVAHEVLLACRLQGWNGLFQPRQERSTLDITQMIIVGIDLVLTPRDKAYESVSAETADPFVASAETNPTQPPPPDA